jgi:dienelactone hydrolase
MMPAMLRRTRAGAAVAAAVILTVVGVTVAHYRRGAAFIVEATGMHGVAQRVAALESEDVTRVPGELTVPWRGGTLRAYAYEPARVHGRGVLLVPGVHASGIDEPRLVGFARDLAAQGHRVITVELPDLKAYAITARTTDQIEDAARWTLSRPEYRGTDGRIGLMGISFGGGLAVAAAGRPGIRDGLAFVLSLGGHGDLPRTLKYLCTGLQPDGVHRPPHDYGLAIVLLGAAAHVVPAEQVDPLRNAILAYLEASRLDMIDKAAAAKEFARAKDLEAQLREPAKTYMDYVNTRDVEKLGPVLVPYLPELGGDPALSPDRSAPPACPVFLLHGADDNVVPAIESTLLAREFRAKGIDVRLLETPLITHAEVDRRSTPMDVWRLVRFWTALLAE